jgi:hypothetical protein
LESGDQECFGVHGLVVGVAMRVNSGIWQQVMPIRRQAGDSCASLLRARGGVKARCMDRFIIGSASGGGGACGDGTGGAIHCQPALRETGMAVENRRHTTKRGRLL